MPSMRSLGHGFHKLCTLEFGVSRVTLCTELPRSTLQEVGLQAVRPSLFIWCYAAVKAAHEADTGCVLFVSVSAVMIENVFAWSGVVRRQRRWPSC